MQWHCSKDFFMQVFEAIRHVDSLVLFVIFILATLNIQFQLTRTYLFQNADNIYPHSSACWLKRFVCTEYNWGLVRQKKMYIRKKEPGTVPNIAWPWILSRKLHFLSRSLSSFVKKAVNFKKFGLIVLKWCCQKSGLGAFVRFFKSLMR